MHPPFLPLLLTHDHRVRPNFERNRVAAIKMPPRQDRKGDTCTVSDHAARMLASGAVDLSSGTRWPEPGIPTMGHRITDSVVTLGRCAFLDRPRYQRRRSSLVNGGQIPGVMRFSPASSDPVYHVCVSASDCKHRSGNSRDHWPLVHPGHWEAVTMNVVS